MFLDFSYVFIIFFSNNVNIRRTLLVHLPNPKQRMLSQFLTRYFNQSFCAVRAANLNRFVPRSTCVVF